MEKKYVLPSDRNEINDLDYNPITKSAGIPEMSGTHNFEDASDIPVRYQGHWKEPTEAMKSLVANKYLTDTAGWHVGIRTAVSGGATLLGGPLLGTATYLAIDGIYSLLAAGTKHYGNRVEDFYAKAQGADWDIYANPKMNSFMSGLASAQLPINSDSVSLMALNVLGNITNLAAAGVNSALIVGRIAPGTIGTLARVLPERVGAKGVISALNTSGAFGFQEYGSAVNKDLGKEVNPALRIGKATAVGLASALAAGGISTGLAALPKLPSLFYTNRAGRFLTGAGETALEGGGGVIAGSATESYLYDEDINWKDIGVSVAFMAALGGAAHSIGKAPKIKEQKTSTTLKDTETAPTSEIKITTTEDLAKGTQELEAEELVANIAEIRQALNDPGESPSAPLVIDKLKKIMKEAEKEEAPYEGATIIKPSDTKDLNLAHEAAKFTLDEESRTATVLRSYPKLAKKWNKLNNKYPDKMEDLNNKFVDTFTNFETHPKTFGKTKRQRIKELKQKLDTIMDDFDNSNTGEK